MDQWKILKKIVYIFTNVTNVYFLTTTGKQLYKLKFNDINESISFIATFLNTDDIHVANTKTNNSSAFFPFFR